MYPFAKNFVLIPIILFLIACGGVSGDSPSNGSTSLTGVNAAPSISDDALLFGTTGLGTIYRFNFDTKVIEEFSDLSDVDSFANYSRSIDVSGDALISASDNNALNVLELETGEHRWIAPLEYFTPESPLNTPTAPVCVADICYAMGASGDLLAIDIAAAEIVWTVDLFPNESSQLKLFPLMVTDTRIFAGGFRNASSMGEVPARLFAISRNTGEVEEELNGGWPSLAGDLLLVDGNGLHAIDVQTLEAVWTLEVGQVGDRAVVGDIVVFHTLDLSDPLLPAQIIVGLNRVNGTVLWSQPGGSAGSALAPYLFDPTTDGRLIYTSLGETCLAADCISGRPMALNPADGSTVWINRSANIRQTKSPIVVKEHLLYDEVWTLDNGAGVYALDPSDGSIQWVLPNFSPRGSLTLFSGGAVIRSNGVPTFNANQ